MFYKTVIPGSRILLGDLWLVAAVAEVELRATETEKWKLPVALTCCFLMEDLLAGGKWGWLGVAGGRLPPLLLPMPRIKLTFDEIQVVIKAMGTEVRAFMWLKALLCFSRDDVIGTRMLIAWLRME